MPSEGVTERHRTDWEALADLDPFWAILSDPNRKFGGWDLAEFFASGEDEIDAALASAARHGLPVDHGLAIDVGCGVGRLTGALARRFTSAVGVDISEGMVVRARELNQTLVNCRFEVQSDPELRAFRDASADLVYSALVLQHLPEHRMIEGYVRSFLRILREGGVAIFQVPTGMPLRKRLQLRRRLYAALRRLRVPDHVLYRRLKLTPIRMNWLAHERVLQLVKEGQGYVLAAMEDGRAGPDIPSRTYMVSKPVAPSSSEESS